MYFLMFIVVFVVIYVQSFKDNFTKEHIDKVVPILALVGIVSLSLCILVSLLS